MKHKQDKAFDNMDMRENFLLLVEQNKTLLQDYSALRKEKEMDSTNFDTLAGTYDHASHFSYDFHGNVPWLIQEDKNAPPGYEQKMIEYD